MTTRWEQDAACPMPSCGRRIAGVESADGELVTWRPCRCGWPGATQDSGLPLWIRRQRAAMVPPPPAPGPLAKAKPLARRIP